MDLILEATAATGIFMAMILSVMNSLGSYGSAFGDHAAVTVPDAVPAPTPARRPITTRPTGPAFEWPALVRASR